MRSTDKHSQLLAKMKSIFNNNLIEIEPVKPVQDVDVPPRVIEEPVGTHVKVNNKRGGKLFVSWKQHGKSISPTEKAPPTVETAKPPHTLPSPPNPSTSTTEKNSDAGSESDESTEINQRSPSESASSGEIELVCQPMPQRKIVTPVPALKARVLRNRMAGNQKDVFKPRFPLNSFETAESSSSSDTEESEDDVTRLVNLGTMPPHKPTRVFSDPIHTFKMEQSENIAASTVTDWMNKQPTTAQQQQAKKFNRHSRCIAPATAGNSAFRKSLELIPEETVEVPNTLVPLAKVIPNATLGANPASTFFADAPKTKKKKSGKKAKAAALDSLPLGQQQLVNPMVLYQMQMMQIHAMEIQQRQFQLQQQAQLAMQQQQQRQQVVTPKKTLIHFSSAETSSESFKAAQANVDSQRQRVLELEILKKHALTQKNLVMFSAPATPSDASEFRPPTLPPTTEGAPGSSLPPDLKRRTSRPLFRTHSLSLKKRDSAVDIPDLNTAPSAPTATATPSSKKLMRKVRSLFTLRKPQMSDPLGGLDSLTPVEIESQSHDEKQPDGAVLEKLNVNVNEDTRSSIESDSKLGRKSGWFARFKRSGGSVQAINEPIVPSLPSPSDSVSSPSSPPALSALQGSTVSVRDSSPILARYSSVADDDLPLDTVLRYRAGEAKRKELIQKEAMERIQREEAKLDALDILRKEHQQRRKSVVVDKSQRSFSEEETSEEPLYARAVRLRGLHRSASFDGSNAGWDVKSNSVSRDVQRRSSLATLSSHKDANIPLGDAARTQKVPPAISTMVGRHERQRSYPHYSAASPQTPSPLQRQYLGHGHQFSPPLSIHSSHLPHVASAGPQTHLQQPKSRSSVSLSNKEMALSPTTLRVIHNVMYAFCPFSIASNIALIACVATTKKFHKTLNYFQTCLACSELYLAVMWIVGNGIAGDEGVCTFVGVTFQFFINSSSCWSLLIPLYCYITIMYSSGTADDWWYYFHAYGWGVPAVLTALAFVFQAAWNRGNVMGDATYECWISSKYPELRVGLFYAPLWIHFGLIIAIFACIFAKIRHVEKQLSESTNSATGSKLGHHSKQSSNSVTGGGSKLGLPSTHTSNSATGSKLGLPVSSHPKSRSTTKQPRNNRIVLWKSSCLALGFLITWTPATAGRIIGLVPGAVVPEWLSILVGLCFATSGFWNPVIFYLAWFWK
ncbi:hypothetical protein HDU98_010567 [Podochytrium sp. JEL0797]|nr:hypothetical protein HDU98_010567 [Podochytrium sp. JEL0797]